MFGGAYQSPHLVPSEEHGGGEDANSHINRGLIMVEDGGVDMGTLHVGGKGVRQVLQLDLHTTLWPTQEGRSTGTYD
jgi:hypothetical protein